MAGDYKHSNKFGCNGSDSNHFRCGVVLSLCNLFIQRDHSKNEIDK